MGILNPNGPAASHIGEFSGPTTGYNQGPLTEAATDFGIRAALGVTGLPMGGTIAGVLDDAEDGKFSATKTGINAATEGLSRALGGYGGLIGPAMSVGYGAVTGGLTGAAKSATRSASQVAGAMLGSTLGPLGSLAGSIGASVLGDMASQSFDDGHIGDALGTRAREGARDRAEDSGFSVGDTARGFGVDAGAYGLDPGLGSSGYGLNPGLSSMDKYGSYSLDDTESLGAKSYGGYSESGGYNGGDGGYGDRGGNDSDSSSSGTGMGGFGGGDMGKGGESW
jgi:hypothetical protein